MIAYVITFIASVLFLISLSLFFFTSSTKKSLYFFFDTRTLNIVIIVRMLMGFIIIGAAPFTGFPNLMLFLGIVVIFLGMTIPFISEQTLDQMAEWWLLQSNWMLRLYALIFAPIWLFFALASIPDPELLDKILVTILPHLH